MKLAFIGFGGAGYGLTKGLRQAGLQEVYFYDKNSYTPPYGGVIKKRADETGAVLCSSMEALLLTSEVVISCVTGATAVSAAESAAPFLTSKHLYVDVNMTSPGVKEEVAKIVEKTGAAFADGAMMGAIPTFFHRVPILASGKGAVRFKESMEPFGMNITCIGEKPGQASAIKMLRSIFMKGLVALLLETLNATHRYHVDQMVLESIAETMESNSFLETVRLQLTKGVANAERMAHEIEEVIKTLEGLDVSATMTQATKEKLIWCSRLGLREHFGGELPETVNEVLEVIEKKIRMTNGKTS